MEPSTSEENKRRSSTFCAMPWVCLEVKGNREIGFCPDNPRALLGKDGNPMKQGEVPVFEAWGSAMIESVRGKMLRGEAVAGCEGCYAKEAAKRSSPREHANAMWRLPKNPGAKAESRPVLLYLHMGNLCNLLCRMCSGDNSFRIGLEQKELIKTDPESKKMILADFRRSLETGDHDLPPEQAARLIGDESDELLYGAIMRQWAEPRSGIAWERSSDIRDIEALIPDLEMVFLTGGEPALIKQTLSFMERCVESGHHRSIHLVMNSNLTQFEGRFLDLIAQFAHMTIQASIDGCGAVNEYIRYPSQWEEVERNFKRLTEIGSLKLKINPVIQIYNVLALAEILRFVEGVIASTGKGVGLEFKLVDSPYLDITALPEAVIQRAVEKISEFRDGSELCKTDGDFSRSVDEVSALLSGTRRAEDSAAKLRDFYVFTRARDRVRGQDFEKTFPELHKMIAAGA